jgi:hypothetical protein
MARALTSKTSHGRGLCERKYLIPASRSLGEQIEKWRRMILPALARVGVRRRGQFFADLRPQAEVILDRRANGLEQPAGDLSERVNHYLCHHRSSLTDATNCKPGAATFAQSSRHIMARRRDAIGIFLIQKRFVPARNTFARVPTFQKRTN